MSSRKSERRSSGRRGVGLIAVRLVRYAQRRWRECKSSVYFRAISKREEMERLVMNLDVLVPDGFLRGLEWVWQKQALEKQNGAEEIDDN